MDFLLSRHHAAELVLSIATVKHSATSDLPADQTPLAHWSDGSPVGCPGSWRNHDTASARIKPTENPWTILILGLVLFLGIHSVHIVAPDARSRFTAARGAGPWKGMFALVSALGLAAIVWGYAQARAQPVVLWPRIPGMAHLAALLTLVAFILLAAAYVPGNGIKARLHHPMVLAVMIWAAAHLLANTTLASVVLFGSFLVWAGWSFRAARQRDRSAGTVYSPGHLLATLIAVVVGAIAWALMAFWGHGAWLGVRPLG